jgi:hypothetical protein
LYAGLWFQFSLEWFRATLGGIMQFTVIIALVVFAVGLWAFLLYLVVRDTRRRSGKWGWNRRRVFCPRCHSRQPIIRIPTSWRQFWWGGWTCKACGCEVDKWGVEGVGANVCASSIPTALKICIAGLILSLCTSLGFLAHAVLLNWWWEAEVYGLAGYQGTERAMEDFRDGKLRLFVVAGERDDDKFSGTNDGPFQIWFPQYYATPYPMRYSVEQEVEFYNRKMRYMYEHPDKFLTSTNRRPN